MDNTTFNKLENLQFKENLLDEAYAERKDYDGYEKEKIDMYRFVDNLIKLIKITKEIVSSIERCTYDNPFSNSKDDDLMLEKIEKEIKRCDKLVDAINKRILKKGTFEETDELELIEDYENLKIEIRDIIKEIN